VFIYILKRLLLMIPTLFGVMVITFVVTQFVPGGPVEQLVQQLQGKGQGGEVTSGTVGIYRGNTGLDPQRIDKLKALYGFDKPAHVRFVDMIKRFLRFDLGESYYHHKSVWALVKSKLPVSITLGLWTFFLTYLICIPLGIKKAVRDGSVFDVATSVAILIGYAIPGFVLALVLIVFFAGGSFWQIFPLRNLVSDGWAQFPWYMKVLDYLWHIVLPISAMMVSSLAVMTVLTKNSFLEEIKKQYVLTARAKGLSERRILYKHVFRNAMIPIITGFPAAFVGAFFTGALLIETIFSLDGIGLLSFESVQKRDYPVVLGTLYVFTIIGLIAKLLSDLSYTFVDRRIQFGAID
jgi:microcin C transport system permease protein